MNPGNQKIEMLATTKAYPVEGLLLREGSQVGQNTERGAEVEPENQVTKTLTPWTASSADCREGGG